MLLTACWNFLSPGDFYSEAHRKIFSIIIELSERNEPLILLL